MLKPSERALQQKGYDPAAFRRLCVETLRVGASVEFGFSQPPLGGCVLKLI